MNLLRFINISYISYVLVNSKLNSKKEKEELTKISLIKEERNKTIGIDFEDFLCFLLASTI